MTRRISSIAFALCALAASVSACGGTGAAPVPPPAAPVHQRTGCAAGPPASVSPGGYYVNGNTVCAADGRAHLFHGVDRPSLEWSSAGDALSRADFVRMASWKANVVRIALNQDFWLAASPLNDPNYASLIDSAVSWAENAGMDVILDLHWSDAGVLGGCPPSAGCQQKMPDANSLAFWSEVAARYRDDGRVLFELYNEPHNVAWDVWRSGGDTGDGWQAVGMQTLYDAVRATGAHNLVVIGGLDWAYDLSGVPAHRVEGYNILYATHPYNNAAEKRSRLWDRYWGFLTETDPVLVTEFGDTNANCSPAYATEVVSYADAHGAGWTAWAWFPGGCGFPSLLEDWGGSATPLGTFTKAALSGYDDPPASPAVPSTSDGKDVAYTFSHGTEGWHLSEFPTTSPTNLGAPMSDGGAAPLPSLAFSPSEGDPDPGAIRMSVTFTGFEQYVAAVVGISAPGIDLSGKTLHARVRLASGSLSAGSVRLIARTGSGYIEAASSPIIAADLAAGTWVSTDLDLGAVTVTGFDPSKVDQIVVMLSSGPSPNDGDAGGADAGAQAFQSTGETVLEIDTVTD